ncbi:hypothetical protein H4W26_000486 [Nesterenkonia halotolerans]|uniref:DUF3784 domain-containing protein n=1 Tax=Nesterenkonia halotolerans TaxID=225325 RepID=A0ABR9J558_9MICC|nr:hypothetical protein [Nesterenkonia halotolerans]
MSLIISSCLVVAGAGLWIASLVITSRANPDVQIPFWRSPKDNPGRSVLFRALGAGLLVAGSIYLGADLGPRWATPLIIITVMATPAMAIIALHNRRVTAAQEA